MTVPDRGMTLELGVLLLNFLAWRFLRVDNRRVRLAIRIVLFGILSYVLWSSQASPLNVAPWADDPARHLLAQVMGLLWWLQAAQVAAATLGILLLPSALQRERLFQDVLHAATFLAAGILAVAHVLNLSVGGLIATSGALAIIFGLAVQSTLSDVFSGVVLNATQPFRVGDLVTIGDIQGQVVESNWRATTLLNSQGNFVVVPNSTTAKSSIVNESRPPLMHGVSISIRVSSRTRPAIVLDGLNDALKGTTGLLSHPTPVANARAIHRRFVDYQIVAYVASADKKTAAQNEIIDQVYRHLTARGVAMGKDSSIEGQRHPFEQLLRGIEMFQTLSNDQICDLASELTYDSFDPGQIIYEVGPHCPDERRALYIVASGVAVSLVPHDGQDVELRRLVPGDAVGRSGVLTGVSTAIKLRAVGRVMVVRLKKDALTPILQEHPEIAKDMLDGLLDYQAKVAEILREIPVSGTDQKSLVGRLLEGMRRMHGLLH
jgi:small-conductance mechanosensitive channel/CRP-like cAMP-binding protein